MPESPEPKQKNWFAKHKVLTAIGVLIVLAVIGGASNGNKSSNTSTPAAPDKTTTATTTATSKASATPTRTPQVLLDLNGSGTKSTQKFTAAGDWDLTWSYDCSNFGSQGNFQVMVYNGDGSLSVENSMVNQLGAKGSDVQHYHKGGTFYLDVNSECSWSVKAQG